MMMCSWSCNVVLYSTVFDLGGPMVSIFYLLKILKTLELTYPGHGVGHRHRRYWSNYPHDVPG
jgi:hypothetical protein